MMMAYYWFEVLSFAGMFFIKGSAPPPSRELMATPELPPRLLDARTPLKYGSRSTAVPLKVPGARMPGTAIPTLGRVSVPGIYC
jgi:hypothetical protein